MFGYLIIPMMQGILFIDQLINKVWSTGKRRITYSLRADRRSDAAVAAWPTSDQGSAKRSRPAAFVRFSSGTFFMVLETCGFLYRTIKNVVNFSRYVQFCLNFRENLIFYTLDILKKTDHN